MVAELCDYLELRAAAQQAQAFLPTPSAADSMKMMDIFEDALTKKYGLPAGDMLLAGVYSCMFANLNEKAQSPPNDFVQVFLIALKEFYVSPKIQKYCEKSFKLWLANKISSQKVKLFLDLIDHHLRFGGSQRPNVEALSELLSSRLLPSRPEFEDEASKVLATF